jgi:hypothetical protein
MKNVTVEISLDTDLLDRQIERIQCICDNLPVNMQKVFAGYVSDGLERDGAALAFCASEVGDKFRLMGAVQIDGLDRIITEALAQAADC